MMKKSKWACFLLSAVLLLTFLAGCADNESADGASSVRVPSEDSTLAEDSTVSEASSEESHEETSTLDRSGLTLLTYEELYPYLSPSLDAGERIANSHVYISNGVYHALESCGYFERDLLCHLRVAIPAEYTILGDSVVFTQTDDEIQARAAFLESLGIGAVREEGDAVIYHGEFLYSDFEKLAKLGGYVIHVCTCEKGEGGLSEETDRSGLTLLTYDVLYSDEHLAPSIFEDDRLFDGKIIMPDWVHETLANCGYFEQDLLCHLRVMIPSEYTFLNDNTSFTQTDDEIQARAAFLESLGIGAVRTEGDTVIYHGEFLYSDIEKLAKLGGYVFTFCTCEKGEGGLSDEET